MSDIRPRSGVLAVIVGLLLVGGGYVAHHVVVRGRVLRAKEHTLREDLFAFRNCLDQYYADKGHFPPSLPALVTERYLRKLPVDPITASPYTWRPIIDPAGHVTDVRSGSDHVATDGSRYSTW